MSNQLIICNTITTTGNKRSLVTWQHLSISLLISKYISFLVPIFTLFWCEGKQQKVNKKKNVKNCKCS